MRIDTVFGDRRSHVVSYYDIEGVRYLIYIPNENAGGANVINISECINIYDEDSQFCKVFNNIGREMFVDRDVLSACLLDELIDHDEGSVQRFYEIKRRIESD